ncbi:MAG: nitroreductase family protein, partial [Oscillospiraceae bacterium]
KNYIALVVKKQGDFYVDCGYYGAHLMIKAGQAGLNSCWVTNTYNAKKCLVSLAPDEELVGVIAIGYGTTDGTQHKSKSMDSLCKPSSDKWFIDGMNAAVLAPTGLNKQNFFIEPNGNTVSIHTKDNSSMSQIDTGIVKYHFEIGAGKESFSWI